MLRNEKGLTMKEMAGMFGLSVSAWNKYEKGESEPRISNMIKMADLFDVSLDFLLGETNIRNSDLIEKSRTVSELIGTFEEISIGDPSKMNFIMENLTVSLEAYKDGKVNEESLQLLLEALGTIIAHFNDLSGMEISSLVSFSEVLDYHNRTSSEIIANLNSILYSMYKTHSKET